MTEERVGELTHGDKSSKWEQGLREQYQVEDMSNWRFRRGGRRWAKDYLREQWPRFPKSGVNDVSTGSICT